MRQTAAVGETKAADLKKQLGENTKALDDLVTAIGAAGKAGEEFAKSGFDEALKSGAEDIKTNSSVLDDARDSLNSYIATVDATASKQADLDQKIADTLIAIGADPAKITAQVVAGLNIKEAGLKTELGAYQQFLNAEVTAFKDQQKQITDEDKKAQDIRDSIYGGPTPASNDDQFKALGYQYNDLIMNTQGKTTDQLATAAVELRDQYKTLWDGYIEGVNNANDAISQMYADGKIDAKTYTDWIQQNNADVISKQQTAGVQMIDLNNKIGDAKQGALDATQAAIMTTMGQINDVSTAMFGVEAQIEHEYAMSVETSKASSAVKSLADELDKAFGTEKMTKALTFDNTKAKTALDDAVGWLNSIPATTTKEIVFHFTATGDTSYAPSGTTSNTGVTGDLNFTGSTTNTGATTPATDTPATDFLLGNPVTDFMLGNPPVPSTSAPSIGSPQPIQAQSSQPNQTVHFSPTIHLTAGAGVDGAALAKQLDTHLAEMWRTNRSALRRAVNAR